MRPNEKPPEPARKQELEQWNTNEQIPPSGQRPCSSGFGNQCLPGRGRAQVLDPVKDDIHNHQAYDENLGQQ